jgi:pyridoxal phosphate enzyme (YggS family)
MQEISDRLEKIHNNIEQACRDAGRDPATVNLLAVSKTKPSTQVLEAFTNGQTHFGENYLQEAVSKVIALPQATWHFIGGVQSNKTRIISEHFDWIHSVDSEKVARRLSEQRPESKPPLKVLLQVNLSREPQKSGLDPERLNSVIEPSLTLPGIELRGLMTLPEPTTDIDLQRSRFAALRELQEQIALKYSLTHFDQLSMGMSEDFPSAILEGATWIRIGTAIFGPREKN